MFGANHRVVARLFMAAIMMISCSDRTSTESDPLPPEVRAYARARCGKISSCECANAAYSSQDECEDKIASIYDSLVDSMGEVELGCFRDAADAWAASECEWPAEVAACDATSRSNDIGTTCDPNLFGDAYLHTPTCAMGLDCVGGTCVEAPTNKNDGDQCSPGGLCGSSLTCIGGVCVPFREVGAPCEVSDNCSPLRELYCGAGTCTERTQNGETCTDGMECRLGVPCAEGRCAPIHPLVCVTADF